MTILVTGAAGFIGSNLVASLNERGRQDIVVCDIMQNEAQWKNLVKRRFAGLVVTSSTDWDGITAVIHLAAVTDTQDTRQDVVLDKNYVYSCDMLAMCQRNRIPFIYASSAAVYGDGSAGFSDAPENLKKLKPLNLYGWSKILFDRHVRSTVLRAPLKAQVVGLRFFNVYGPNEYHKGKMASLVQQQYDRVRTGGKCRLFGFTDRERSSLPPMRDFVYVEDVVNVILWMLDHPEVSGIFNVGTGESRTFEALARATFAWQEEQEEIDYVEHPAAAQATYQFYTNADLTNLRKVGCDVPFRPIEEGVKLYVEKYLSQKDRYR